MFEQKQPGISGADVEYIRRKQLDYHDLVLAHQRYEKLRKLNARQFDDLYEKNIKGQNFDQLVDEL